jgi:hypothetical protein
MESRIPTRWEVEAMTGGKITDADYKEFKGMLRQFFDTGRIVMSDGTMIIPIRKE